MATDDVTTLRSSCLCGKGLISVTQTHPDHPWVRASQIHYSGQLDCAECSEKFAIVSQFSSSLPRMVLRADLEAKAKAEAAVQAARKVLDEAPEVAAIRKVIVAKFNAQPSKAAKHRLLQSLKLTSSSYSSFIKDPDDAEHHLRWTSGWSLAKAGVQLGLPEAAALSAQCAEVDALQDVAWAVSVKTIPTGATWMQT